MLRYIVGRLRRRLFSGGGAYFDVFLIYKCSRVDHANYLILVATSPWPVALPPKLSWSGLGRGVDGMAVFVRVLCRGWGGVSLVGGGGRGVRESDHHRYPVLSAVYPAAPSFSPSPPESLGAPTRTCST